MTTFESQERSQFTLFRSRDLLFQKLKRENEAAGGIDVCQGNKGNGKVLFFSFLKEKGHQQSCLFNNNKKQVCHIYKIEG